MPIDFPSGPTTGQVYSYLGKSWVYNGSAWDTVSESYGDAVLPAGSIIQWVSNTLPLNWLLCNGSAVSRSEYPSLFAAIGTQYGVGDGTTTFNLPDLRGRVGVGRDASQTEFDVLGETGGAKTHTLTIAEIPSHTHTYGSGSSLAANGSNHGTAFNNGSYTSGATGGGGAHNNLQPYQVLNYIIKASAGTTTGDSELATRVGALENETAPLLNPVFSGTITGLPAEPSANTNTASSLGYVGLPQVILASGNLTLSKAHAGEHIHVTGASQTITIPANSSVAFEIGTTIVVINANVTSSIAITTDTLRLAGTTTTGTRTLAAWGMATIVKISSTVWIASGNGLT
jgi:microcystin-dependent protein